MTEETQPAEAWAWEQIQSGEIADFNARCGETLDPRKPRGWSNDRKLGSDFLRRLFFGSPDQNAMPPEGVRIIGAFLPDGQVLQFARLNRQVWLSRCRSQTLIDFQGTTFSGWLSFRRSFLGRTGSTSIALRGTRIEGGLDFSDAIVEGALDGDGLNVGQSLFMRSTRCKGDVILRGSNINGQLVIEGSIFEKMLDGDELVVRQSLS